MRAVAHRLGLTDHHDLLRAIPDAVERKVAGWLHELNIVPAALSEVHRLTLNRTRLHVRRVESDDDLLRIGRELSAEIPNLPAQLELEFNDTKRQTEAFLMRRSHHNASYLAVIDARGERRHRAWYAERHETSHLLAEDPSTDQIWRRSNDTAPIERIVDAVAARVGFWPDLVRPIVASASLVRPLIPALLACRDNLAPNASIEASFRSFVEHLDYPVLLIDTAQRSRRNDVVGTSTALRVRTIIFNRHAHAAKLFVPDNYRIPAHSVIHQADRDSVLHQEDCLGRWNDSRGKCLRTLPVQVEAHGRWAALTLR